MDARGPPPVAGRHAARRRSSGTTSTATGQRGWNGHPVGSVGRIGRVAAEPARSQPRRRVADRRERAGQRAGVRVLRIAEQRRALGPSSTIRPAYITASRRHADVSTDRSWVMNSIAMPASRWSSAEQVEHLGLDHHVERGRRLVGDQQRRLARQGEGDEHPLALAARQLVRVLARPAAPAARPARAARRRVAWSAAAPAGGVQLDGLGDLVADPLHRVERVQRALEHDRRARPAHGAQPPRLHRRDVLAAEQDLRPRCASPGGSRRSTAAAIVDLPQPDSPASPTVSPAPSVEVDAADRRHVDVAGAVRHAQVASSSTARHHVRSRSRGSRISSSARPHIVNASTTSDDPDAGGQVVPPGAAGDRAGLVRLLEHLAPRRRLRVAEAEERQRRLGEDGDRHGERRVGEDQRGHVGQHVPADDVAAAGAERPGALDERAARATDSTWARVIRATYGHDVTPMTRITFHTDGPRMRASTIASGRNGITRNQSVRRIRNAVGPAAEEPGDDPDERRR